MIIIIIGDVKLIVLMEGIAKTYDMGVTLKAGREVAI
jgi:hypothetical protein